MKCKICNWEVGYCHKHHIIPLSKGGKDVEENIMILCPNHHSEATKIGYEKFNIKFKIVGGVMYNIELLNKVAIEYYFIIENFKTKQYLTNTEKCMLHKIREIMQENDWDEYDMYGQLLGVTKRYVINNLSVRT